jgi:hypothetical protein
MRHLTDRSTPYEVAITNDLIAQVKLHWRLACAWERKDPAHFDGRWSPENPYAADYRQAVHAYDKHRSGA